MFKKYDITLLHAPLQGFYDFYSIKQIANYFKELEGPVLIHAHGFRMIYTALMARKLSGKKEISLIMTRHKVRRAVDSWILRFIYRNLDALIFVSRTARDRFVSTWHTRMMPISASRMYIIHNSLYMDLPEYSEPSSNRPLTAMFHGPIKPGKGLETLIDALGLLKGKRIRIKIVGSGAPDYLDKLRRRAISRGVMEMIDWHKHTSDPLSLIKECHFGVLPSSQEEAFGLANIEYMAAGRPHITTSNGAQQEYITDGWEGFLIPPLNPTLLAETIHKLASDPDLRLKMGRRAFDSFNQRLSWSHFIDPLTKLYLQATETRFS